MYYLMCYVMTYSRPESVALKHFSYKPVTIKQRSQFSVIYFHNSIYKEQHSLSTYDMKTLLCLLFVFLGNTRVAESAPGRMNFTEDEAEALEVAGMKNDFHKILLYRFRLSSTIIIKSLRHLINNITCVLLHVYYYMYL